MCRCEQKKRRFTSYSDKQLRRARFLYVSFCRQAIALDKTGEILAFCAGRMAANGFYAYGHIRSIQYSILRQIWRWDHQSKLQWLEWCRANGWENEYGNGWVRKQDTDLRGAN